MRVMAQRLQTYHYATQPKFDSIEAPTVFQPELSCRTNKQTRVSVFICAGRCFTVSSTPLLRVDSTGVIVAKVTACARAHTARAAWRPLQGVGSMSFSSSVMAIIRKGIATTPACNMVIIVCSRKGESCPCRGKPLPSHGQRFYLPRRIQTPTSSAVPSLRVPPLGTIDRSAPPEPILAELGWNLTCPRDQTLCT
jgi:hypothetical protein